MRLGIVMTGTGALAAACIGAMQELEKRGIEPFAVCGMQSGAWPAALWISGQDADSMQKAMQQTAHMGSRILKPAYAISAILRKKRCALVDSGRIEHLLINQTGKRLLCVCKRPGFFLCRTAQTGRRVIFSSKAFAQEGQALLSTQASVSFAARAAMTPPPFLEPLCWMGSCLIAENDVNEAGRQLLAMGAQRVLVIAPVPSRRHIPDALDLVGMADGAAMSAAGMPEMVTLDIEAPDVIGALSVDQLPAIVEAGRMVAAAKLDEAFEKLGMAPCRILPFKRPYIQTGTT